MHERVMAPKTGEVIWGQLQAEVAGCFAVNEVDEDGVTMVAGYFLPGEAPSSEVWAAAVAAHVPEQVPAAPGDPVAAAAAVIAEKITEAIDEAPNNVSGLGAAITAGLARAVAELT